MTYFSHPLIKPGSLQARDYQTDIANRVNQNTLVILPTGLGKTPVALMVMADMINGANKALLVAPTKPLCDQHYKYFADMLPYTAVRILTGEKPAAERLLEWTDAQVIIATPQTIENDLKNDIYNLSLVSLVVIDEAHRAVGGYAYTYIAERYQNTNLNGLILALTASPGGDEERVNAIKTSLNISQVILKTEQDPDVKPYLHEKEIDKLYLDLPEPLRKASIAFQSIISDRVKQMREMGIKVSLTPGMKELNRIKAESNKLISEQNGTGYALAAAHAEIMKLKHAILVAETQGILPLLKYLDKLKDDEAKSSKRIMSEPGIQTVYRDLSALNQGEIHPKTLYLPGIVSNQLNRYPDSRILIFASYRDTGKYIADVLKHQKIKCSVFTGQGARGKEKGMSQKKQQETIQKFRNGDFKVLVATSVAEEGLDIPACDSVIFYEPVPSEIRSIQRRGRTGRFADGKVLVMVTKNTVDEVNLITAQRKEEKMRDSIIDITDQTVVVDGSI